MSDAKETLVSEVSLPLDSSHPDIADLLASLNQALVPVNRVAEREFCYNCVNSIQFVTSQRKGYLVWENGFVAGQWDSKEPETAKTVYRANEVEFHFQRLFIHPALQADRFLEEAKFKFWLHKVLLEKLLGEEIFGKVVSHFAIVLEAVKELKIEVYNGLLPYRRYYTLDGLSKKSDSLTRCLYLKLKKLIKSLQPLVAKELDLMMSHHQHPSNCFFPIKSELHHSDDSDDSE